MQKTNHDETLQKVAKYLSKELKRACIFQARHRLRAETNRADDYAEQLMTVQAASAALIQGSQRRQKSQDY